MPNNTTRVFSDGATPWIQYVAPSNVVASGSQPTLPKIARMAMIADASRRCAERLDQDSGKHEAQFQSDWIEVLSAIKTQANGKGRKLLRPDANILYRRPQLVAGREALLVGNQAENANRH